MTKSVTLAAAERNYHEKSSHYLSIIFIAKHDLIKIIRSNQSSC
jgi:hypothetical protein